MAAVIVFEGFKSMDAMTEIRGEMLFDVLGLTKEDMQTFPMPDYSQIVSHLKPISDSEVRGWIITNIYSPVLKSRSSDALKAFRTFCSDLRWDINEIKENMKLTEDLLELKPIDNGVRSAGLGMGMSHEGNTNSGCLSVIAIILVCTALATLVLI